MKEGGRTLWSQMRTRSRALRRLLAAVYRPYAERITARAWVSREGLCQPVAASHTVLEFENLALRHQIGVLQRSARKRPKLTAGDRLLWICLSRLWCDWRSALSIVKPETVAAWHRAGFRLFWTWKVRRGQRGRPVILREVRVRDLIRKMCRENPSWGAPRIHGELLKLGIDIGESSASKYMVRCRRPPSQTWRTPQVGGLHHHYERLAA
jgi:hypothetical protein